MFIKIIFKQLLETFNIDENRIYATGFSNGGGFVHSRIIPELNHLFAAVAGNTGMIRNEFDIEGPIPPVISMIGTADENLEENHPDSMLPFAIEEILQDTILGLFIDSSLYSLQLNREYTYDSTQSSIMLHFEKPLANNTNEWHLIIVKDLTHVYPNGENNVWNFVAAPFYWEFFQKQLSDQVTPLEELSKNFQCIIQGAAFNEIDFSCFIDNEPEAIWDVQVSDITGIVWDIQRLNKSTYLTNHLPKGLMIVTLYKNHHLIRSQKVINL